MTLLGHSIGRGIIWSYVEFFWSKKYRKNYSFRSALTIMSMFYDCENVDKKPMHVHDFLKFI